MASTDIVICGAGIAGISAAFQLAVRNGVRNITLVDAGAPLSLTSDKSTECYRNWWPGPGDAMVSMMNRSIDILEELAGESDNIFHMNRRGYLYVTTRSERIEEMRKAGEEAASLGAGPLRCHPGNEQYSPSALSGFAGAPIGSDLILDRQLIHKYFPYLSEQTIAVLHARRCGWLSAQQLGMYMLERAKQAGVRFISGQITGVEVLKGHIEGVRLGDGSVLNTQALVVAAGPLLKQVGEMLGVDLPVFCELHTKVSFRDDANAYPKDSPLLIYTDPQYLPWSEEERALFGESEETRPLLSEFPSGVHARAESGTFMGLWTFHNEHVPPAFPIPLDPQYPEVVLHGLSSMIPALSIYFERTPRNFVDGGYYLKTQENRPLIGPLPVRGAFVIGALSGYGVMASCGAGELLAAHVLNKPLPRYANAFRLERYQDPAYQRLLGSWGSSGQL